MYMQSNTKRTILYIFLIGLIISVLPILFGGVLYIAYRVSLPSLKVDEYEARRDKVIQQAERQKDVTVCGQLPTELRYLARSDDDGKGISDPNIPRTGKPRDECIDTFYRDSNDPASCTAIAQRGGDTNDCYLKMSELYSDPSFCDHLVYTSNEIRAPALVECRAIAKLDVTICQQTPLLSPQNVKEGTAECIQEVAERTGDARACLTIDGPSYGVQWQVFRNQCVEYVAESNRGIDPKSVCALMVEDSSGYDARQRCLRGQFAGYLTFPKRLKRP